MQKDEDKDFLPEVHSTKELRLRWGTHKGWSLFQLPSSTPIDHQGQDWVPLPNLTQEMGNTNNLELSHKEEEPPSDL